VPLLCPDDRRPLEPHSPGDACPGCAGLLCSDADLGEAVPGATLDALTLEVPLATWGIAVLLTAVFTYTELNGGSEAFAQAHGYDPSRAEPLAALAACFLHFGWLHLLGNLYFLLSFGDGVEQRVPRPVVALLFAGLGTLSLYLDGLFEPTATIAGASGGIAALMGACIVLQPQAKVVMRLGAPVVQLPIVAYGAIELAYQGLMSLTGVPGTAWIAHLSGLGLGVGAGLAAKRLWPEPQSPLSPMK
jgi:membrane associated rhomboid family serine protease